MAAITGDFPPGPYTATFGGGSNGIGLMEGPIRHQQSLTALPVRCSLYGQNIIDYIIQGGGVFVVMTVKEWNVGARRLMWPFGDDTTDFKDHGVMPITGKLFNTYCKQLVLTALPGTPAATEGPLTRTYPLAALLPGHNLDVTFGPVERNIPIVLAVLPQKNQSTDGQPTYFTDTYA